MRRRICSILQRFSLKQNMGYPRDRQALKDTSQEITTLYLFPRHSFFSFPEKYFYSILQGHLRISKQVRTKIRHKINGCGWLVFLYPVLVIDNRCSSLS